MMSKGATSSSAWIKIFAVSNPQEHPDGFTVYRVVQTSFPVSTPDLSTTISCWKRWSQIKTFHKSLETIHRSLYLAGDFPPLPRSTFFNRKDPVLVEERRQACQDLLEFAATFPALFSSPAFKDFFKSDVATLDPDTNSESSAGRLTSPDNVSLTSSFNDLTVTVNNDLSIDTTPTLTPERSPSFPEAPSKLVTSTGKGLPDHPSSPTPAAAAPAASAAATSEDVGGGGSNNTPTAAADNIASATGGSGNFEDADGGIPGYITEAAAIIATALSLEADQQFEESIAAYRSAIGVLLSSVQADPDEARRSSVKKRVAQYISKAEQLVQQELEYRTRKSSRKLTGGGGGIPHLQLFGQLDQLRHYHVIDILDRKIILARHGPTSQQVIFKVLQKSAAVYKKSKTSLLPINIAYMVGLLKYFETDEAVYLMLEYCPAGRLWDVVKPLVLQQLEECRPQTPGPTTSSSPSRKTSILRPSESFIQIRKASVNPNISDSDSDLGDISVVHAEKSSLLVISDNKIQHYGDYCPAPEEGEEEREEDFLPTESEQLSFEFSEDLRPAGDNAATGLLLPGQAAGPAGQLLPGQAGGPGSGILSHDAKVTEGSTSEITSDIATIGERKLSERSVVFGQPTTFEDAETEGPSQSTGGSDCESAAVFEIGGGGGGDCEGKAERPRLLRKLSEVLPRCPDPTLQDSTVLPDRVLRLWAAELVQVLSSLHYREIIIKDLNPNNLLLDCTGHLKLSYQCEWVSIERELATPALHGNYTAPEVTSVGDVTPAADWWSFGAILHLFYTGRGPSSLIPTGLDSTIPLAFPDHVSPDARQFLAQLLQVYPVNRLGAGTMGSLDVRNHPYFNNFDWAKMTFID